MSESLTPDELTMVLGADAPGGQAEGLAQPSDDLPERIGGRYRVERLLGRGGMAVVYRVLDEVGGRALALKQLSIPTTDRNYGEQAAAFEREYHTLVQLSHPRIIEVYEFGADPHGRYYTMELLDGGDLRELASIPWQQACVLFYDVCSSLALVHSRGFVHRDVTPRNIRGSHDGSAKLIDFGALAPMGPGSQVVGTPPFIAPEVLHRSTLDARTDLFSLGATLYFALTGRIAYPARDFSRLQEVWSQRPPQPSAVMPGIPAGLDALVMSMLSLDPTLRPRSAYDVMQRLAALAGIERDEAADVSQAYVSTPIVVGRVEALAQLRAIIAQALSAAGASVLVSGVAGVGRSRILDISALDAKVAGATVLRVNAGHAGSEALSAGQALIEQAFAALPAPLIESAEVEQASALIFSGRAPGAAAAKPELKQLSGRVGDRAAIQSAVTRVLLRLAETQPLVILVDDVQRLDEASLALLAALSLAARARKLVVLATVEAGAAMVAADAFAVLKRESVSLPLEALSPEQVAMLLASVFGDMPNLALISERLYQAAAGNPRETMDLLQSLLTRGLVRYEGGQWLLPSRLDPAELPTSAIESCKRGAQVLGPVARVLAELHAVGSHPLLSREDYALAATEIESEQLDAAVTELLSARVIVGDGRTFALSRREWSDALLSGLSPSTAAERHRMLARVYAKRDTLALERAHHLLLGKCEAEGLTVLVELLARTASTTYGLLSLTTMNGAWVGRLLDRALTCAEALDRQPAELSIIRRAMIAVGVIADEAYYYRAAPHWLSQLKRDSGLAAYQALTEIENPNDRLMRALTIAGEQYAATDENQRVYTVEEAVRGLAYYAAVSIAIGSRAQDTALIGSLPALLAPFSALSPLLNAMWQNTIATADSLCGNRLLQARTRWTEVEAALATITSQEASYVHQLRAAIAYGIGLIEARMGLPTSDERLDFLDSDAMQRSSAMSLRRIARLHQGDFAGAERFRKRAELLALHANVPSMFRSTLPAELIAHAMSGDLAGIRQMAEEIAPLAARFAGWVGHRHLAEGLFEQARGRLEAARQAFERGLSLTEPDPREPLRSSSPWPRLESVYIELMVALDRAPEAKLRGVRALQMCEALGIEDVAIAIHRSLALAEAKVGDYAGASARLDAAIAQLTAMGSTGLEAGATYEARARIAIWAGDTAAVEHYARLAAQQYRYGQGSPLGARYERLMDEARRTGVGVLPELSDFLTKLTTSSFGSVLRKSTGNPVRDVLADAPSARERAQRALELLCQARSVKSGHLYLSTEHGLELVASRGGHDAGGELKDLVTRYVTELLDADSVATMFDPGSNASALTGTPFRDQHGAIQQTDLLMGEIDGMKVCVGAAVLEARGQTVSESDARSLLAEVGSYLLEVGDARVRAR